MANKPEVSQKINKLITKIHRAFTQPKSSNPDSLRKQYWQEAWSDIKRLPPEELEEFQAGVEIVRQTLRKLNQKVERIRQKKIEEEAKSRVLSTANEWEDDDFLNSSANLPVFKTKPDRRQRGKNWVITKPMEKPKNSIQICQAVWIIITNRAIYLVDKGKKDIKPSAARDTKIEKHRLMVLPHLLDDKIITDQITGKPVMNLYMINREVKETLLWLLADRAKEEKTFCRLFRAFLKQEIIEKSQLFEWAKKYSPLAEEIYQDLRRYK